MNILGHDSLITPALVSQHAAVLGRVCMALLGSQSEAQQALQDTLLAALSEPTGPRGDGATRAWLCGIARRKCAQRLAARTRERELRQSTSAAPGAAETSADRPSMPQRARRLLGEIRPSEREALVLRFAAELSFAELGEAAGIDEATACKRVSRGLSRMRALLGEEKS